MAFLCISNGRSSTEIIKLVEGEQYEIDKETLKFFDSDHIREKYKKKLNEFNNRYPWATSASIRIFDENQELENGLIVLYKKHLIAFKEIVRNQEFMKYLCKVEFAKEKSIEEKGKRQTIYIDEYERKGILFRSFDSSVDALLRNIRALDKKRDGVSSGGKRYYDFMRYVLLKYDYYIEHHNKNLPTVNKIYKDYLSVLENAKLQKETEAKEIAEIMSYEVESSNPQKIITETDFVDQVGYEEMMNPEMTPYSFFENPHFDKNYYSLLANAHMSILGDSKEKEDYKDWYYISDRCFTGNICCPALAQGYNLYNDFDNSHLNIFYCIEKNKEIERNIARSIINKAPTVVISHDIELLELYRKKYQDIKTIHYMENEKEVSERELIEMFIKLYNDEYKKVYSK